MKKLVYGIVALAFVFTVSLTLNAQTDGTEKAPQKVETKKDCKTTCNKTAKKECTTEEKAACDKTTKAACDKSAKKESTKK
ncbi:MAG: hypothetical protein PF484_06060 [Bacteroidales bacterium]|jgi:Ni/Co efflux regulator RcnB|nr:hypothetical protein [Bacteroidales bacterium]